MLRKTLVLSLIGTAFLPACDRTATPGGGQTTTGCSFAGNQAASGLTIDCTVTGGLPNRLIDPTNPSSTGCGLASVSLFSQTLNVPVRLIYAENGDDNSGRVRVGAMIPRVAGQALATHAGSLAKAAVPDCNGITGPTVPLSTSFGGRHIAIVDKEQSPLCVFQSRLDLAPYNQTIGTGLTVNVSNATRDAVRDEMWRRLDLEIATAVNGLLAPSANLGGAFQTNSGRCSNDWQAFVGN
jgi:hypothetical protein